MLLYVKPIVRELHSIAPAGYLASFSLSLTITATRKVFYYQMACFCLLQGVAVTELQKFIILTYGNGHSLKRRRNN